MPVRPEVAEAAKARRARIWQARKDGGSWEDIAAAEGCPTNRARAWYAKAVRLDGLEDLAGTVPKNAGAMAEDPEVLGGAMAAVIVAEATMEPGLCVSDKFKALHEACREAGLKPALAKSLIRRMRASLAPVLGEGKALTVAELTKEIERKWTMCMSYMDDFAYAQASLKDLSINASVLVEKHQLLSNRPTMIVDVTSRMQLVELVPQMLAEARRRGITTVEGVATVVKEGP